MNFQQEAVRQGQIWEQTCKQALVMAGFTIGAHRFTEPISGAEIDYIVTNLTGDISFYVNCKGSLNKDRPGCKRTDTLLKAIAVAHLLSMQGLSPFLLMTSHIPHHGVGKKMLDCVPRHEIFDVIEPYGDGKRLYWLARATEAELKEDLRRFPTIPELLKSRS